MEGGAEAVPHCSVGIIGVLLDIMYVRIYLARRQYKHKLGYEIGHQHTDVQLLHNEDQCRRKRMLGKGEGQMTPTTALESQRNSRSRVCPMMAPVPQDVQDMR